MQRLKLYTTPALIQAVLVTTLVVLSSPSHVLATDLWPLVKQAENAVWGTLTEIVDGDEDRILRIEVTGGAGDSGTRGPASLRLLERAGRFPEGTSLRSGVSGLFLYRSPVDDSGEFASVDGWFVAGGFFPLESDPAAQAAVAALVDASLNAPIEGIGPAQAVEPTEAVATLLASDEPGCRLAALSWLRRHSIPVGTALQEVLAEGFAREPNEVVQCEFLELFLLEELPLAGERATSILLSSEEPVLLESALTYLAQHATTRSTADLLRVFPEVRGDRRLILLEAYARMELAESKQWWLEALLSEDRVQVDAALAGFGSVDPAGAETVYRSLLTSSSERLRRTALRGLGGLATRSSREAIVHFLNGADEGDALRGLARRILEKPRRYASRPASPTEVKE